MRDLHVDQAKTEIELVLYYVTPTNPRVTTAAPYVH